MERTTEILTELIKLGASVYPDIADPSTRDILRELGVAPVTAHIEMLSKIGLTKDAVPLFGKGGGMWIGYSLSELGMKCSSNEALLNEALSRITERPVNEVTNAVGALAQTCKQANLNENYKNDFVRTIEEIAICFQNDCYIASISLCGKVFEICLTALLVKRGITIADKAMLGQLISLVRQHLPDIYLDEGFENLAVIISKSRNTAIHFNERIPIPSRDQTVMVIFAVRDVILRNLQRM